MKKIFFLALAAALTVSMISCEDLAGNGEQGTPDAQMESTNPNDASSDEAAQDDTSAETEAQDATIAETVLVDEAGVKITATELNYDEILGVGLKFLLENDSGKDLTIQCTNVSINGYMGETTMSAKVANGKKANEKLLFLDSTLEDCGITAIADMEFSFHIFESEGLDDYLDTPQMQLKTSIADHYEYRFDDSGNVIFDGNGVKIVVKELNKDGFMGAELPVYLENNTEKEILVSTRDVSVNGFMVNALFTSSIMPGKKAVGTIRFLDADLEKNGITDLQDAELHFHISDMSTFETIVDTDAIHFAF